MELTFYRSDDLAHFYGTSACAQGCKAWRGFKSEKGSVPKVINLGAQKTKKMSCKVILANSFFCFLYIAWESDPTSKLNYSILYRVVLTASITFRAINEANIIALLLPALTPRNESLSMAKLFAILDINLVFLKQLYV